MSKKKYARQKKHQQKHSRQATPKPVVVHKPEVFCFVSTNHVDLTERHTCMERYEHQSTSVAVDTNGIKKE